MKKILFVVLLGTIASALHAQKNFVIPNAQLQPYLNDYKIITSDTAAFRKLLMQQFKKQTLTDNMPVVALNSIKLQYRGNNGNGLDIYQANIDNMYVVKPDATFSSAMPVTTYSPKIVTVRPPKK
ncbi:MAG TPA: hypothetical protein VG738_24110 [Chitinophagaceae bacterium]|nr:hypothetical protein [Chitinophagaceae bacterium]